MAIASDFSVALNGDIRYTGSTTNYTVLQLHRYLQGLAASSSSSGDDLLDMIESIPSDKQFDTIITLLNGYNIDDTAAQHLYGGSISQTNGDVVYDGVQVIAPAGMRLEIIQNGALATNFWTTGLNADATNGISHQFLLKVRTGAADIDGRRLIATSREWGKTYLEFKINGTVRGVNVIAMPGWADDLNNTTVIGSLTSSPFSGVNLVTAGYNGIDVNNDSVNENYYSKWDRATASINQFYERMKYLTRRSETTTLFGIAGQLFRGVTHEIVVDTPTGTFSAVETLSWGTGATAGTGRMLAINSTTAPTKLWIQLLTGIPPVDNMTMTGVTSTATCLMNVTITERTISAPFIGQSTGLSIIGAYGAGIEAADLSATDKVFDLTNTQITPPNNVVYMVSNLVAGGTPDYIIVGPSSAGALQLNQFTLNGALTGAAVTSLVVNQAIPADTPSSGSLRVLCANGVYRRVAYSAYNSGTKTFTITSTDFSTNNAANGANTFISYIDKAATSTSESFTAVYSGSDRVLFVRVRNAAATPPIKTFETTGTLSSAGGSSTVVRSSDA